VPDQPGRLIGFVKEDGTPESMFIDEDTATELVPNLAALKPMGGTIPAPSWAKPPSPEPVMSETMKRALEMKARGELPTPPRRDKETWRDEKPLTPPSPTPVLTPATPPPTKSSNPHWWIVGAIATLAAVVFIVRHQRLKV
jgi:hypothetical protein